jgi:hypothetical protein
VVPLHESASDGEIAGMSHPPSPSKLPLPSTRSLDPERIVHTIAKLGNRIAERFPGSGLGRLCASLLDIGEQTRDRLDRIERPVW